MRFITQSRASRDFGGLSVRNHLVNMVKGQFPSTGAGRQKDTAVEMLVWWHGEKVVHLGNEGVVQ